MEYKKEFLDWINDDNVIQFSNGFGTQDAQYRNRLKNYTELYKYFIKEFISV